MLGGTWSCSPSILYQIPTEIFDLYMMLGRLNDKEDLDALMEKISEDKIQVNETYGCTDIWVGVGGNWSGLPSMHFKIPSDVFEYLQQRGNTLKTISRLTTEEELIILITQMRNEMESGVVAQSEVLVRSQPKNTELKECGHVCTTSSLKQGVLHARRSLSFVHKQTGIQFYFHTSSVCRLLCV